MYLYIFQGDSIDVVTNQNETNEERYIEKLIESGYTKEYLDKMARTIQVSFYEHFCSQTFILKKNKLRAIK